MSSTPSLPYELIAEILSPVLHVPASVFTYTGGYPERYPYLDQSSAEYLRVSKSWLHVGRPLLYNVVILRSRDQVKALARTLAANPEAARWVKKLRVESGYCTALRHILIAAAPTLTHLSLCLDVWSPDTVDPTCRALKLVNPSTLVLHHRGGVSKSGRTKMVTRLANGVEDAIPGWTNLTTLYYNYLDHEHKISRPIIAAGRLRSLHLSHIHTLAATYKLLASACPLESIHMRYDVGANWRDWVEKDQALRRVVRFPLQQKSLHVDWATVNIEPLLAASREEQNAIWSRVLYFTTQESALGHVRNHSSRLKLRFVSKSFYQLALPYLFRHIHLRWANVQRDLEVSLLQHLERAEAEYQSVIGPQTLTTDNVYATALSWDMFCQLARKFGSTLQLSDVNVDGSGVKEPRNVALLSSLIELTRLVWNCVVVFDIARPDTELTILPKVNELELIAADQTFLDALAHNPIPKLTTFRTEYRPVKYSLFLAAHGPTLIDLAMDGWSFEALSTPVLELCPRLTRLAISSPGVDTYSLANLLPRTPHPSFLKLTVNWQPRIVLPRHYSAFESLITSSETKRLLPEFQEVVLVQHQWPRIQRLIAGNSAIWWAEMLESKQKLWLVDRDGRRWRRRYKFPGPS